LLFLHPFAQKLRFAVLTLIPINYNRVPKLNKMAKSSTAGRNQAAQDAARIQQPLDYNEWAG